MIPEILQPLGGHSPLQGTSMDPTSHGLGPHPPALQSFSLDAQGAPGRPQTILTALNPSHTTWSLPSGKPHTWSCPQSHLVAPH